MPDVCPQLSALLPPYKGKKSCDNCRLYHRYATRTRCMWGLEPESCESWAEETHSLLRRAAAEIVRLRARRRDGDS